jgi:hypothetical protein
MDSILDQIGRGNSNFTRIEPRNVTAAGQV